MSDKRWKNNKDEEDALKYLGLVKYLGGVTDPVMPSLKILRRLFPLRLFIGHDGDRSILE